MEATETGQMNTTSDCYRKYIQSDRWQAFASKRKAAVGNRCQLCNDEGALHAHHRTYARLGHEDDDDVTVLCERCHEKVHDILPVHGTAAPACKLELRLVALEVRFAKIANILGRLAETICEAAGREIRVKE